MAYLVKNPLIASKTGENPPNTPKGMRGIFPKDDGWYDIDENGEITKIPTKEDIESEATDRKLADDLKQDKVDNSLNTKNKTIIGAINELNENINILVINGGNADEF